MRRTGYLPDPPVGLGGRPDWLASRVLRQLPAPPAAASARHLVLSVLDQGALGSCVANAVAQAIRASQARQQLASHATPQLASRLWIYYLARASHGDERRDSGTFLRAAFDAVRTMGFPEEAVHPYNDGSQEGSPAFRMPPTNAFRLAFDQRRPTQYWRIDQLGDRRLDEVKRAIAAGYLVCFGTDVSADFANDIGTRELIGPPVDQEIAGGHAMCVAGYDEQGFDVVNSWGLGWGLSGWCRFSPDYLAWGRTRDLWIVQQAPAYATWMPR